MSDGTDISFRSLFSDLLDFLYPPQCQICKKGFVAAEGNIWICDDCRKALIILPNPCCPVCRTLLPDPDKLCSHCRRRVSIQWLYSLGTYDDYYSHLIKAVKYLPRPGLGRLLGKMLGERLRQFPHTQILEVVCAVPIHHKKESQRGFNQAELLAEAVANELEIEYQEAQLVQTVKNLDQIGLTVAERFRNVHGAFAVSEDFVLKGKNVLLIDDVTTSGATLNSAATTLINAGVNSVAAATVAVALEEGIDPAALYRMLSEEF